MYVCTYLHMYGIDKVLVGTVGTVGTIGTVGTVGMVGTYRCTVCTVCTICIVCTYMYVCTIVRSTWYLVPST